MREKRFSVRFDDRTWMLLRELSGMTGAKVSVIIRSMINREIDGLIDKSGNWKIDESRQIQKGKHSIYIAGVIGRNYSRLHQLCSPEKRVLYGSRTYEDIFSDTIVYVIHDEASLAIIDEDNILKHFCHRYKMIEFQTIKDAQQLKEIHYADYLQAQKETTEE